MGKNCDMPEEMRQDCVDLVITAIERFAGTPQSYESAARLVKETMDKKYNESWVVVIGQGFAFEVTHELARGKQVRERYCCVGAILGRRCCDCPRIVHDRSAG